MTKLLRSSAALDTVREGVLACLGMLTGDIARCVPVVVPVAGPIVHVSHTEKLKRGTLVPSYDLL